MDTNAAPYNDVRVRQAMKLLIDRKQAIVVAPAGLRPRSGTTSFAKLGSALRSTLPQRHVRPREGEVAAQGGRPARHRRSCCTRRPSSPTGAAGARLRAGRQEGRRQGRRPDRIRPTRSGTRRRARRRSRSAPGATARSSPSGSSRSSRTTRTRRNGTTTRRSRRASWSTRRRRRAIRRSARSIAFAAQKLHWDDGGYIIPYFKQTIDGAPPKVQGHRAARVPVPRAGTASGILARVADADVAGVDAAGR